MAQAPRKEPAQDPAGSTGNRLTPKQMAAAAKAEAEAAERRRERTIRLVGGLAVLLIVAGLLAVGILSGRDNQSTTLDPATPDANAALPTGVQADTFGYQAGTAWQAPNAADLPTLEVWADFQCPACKQFETIAGENLTALSNESQMKLLLRPTTFLDNSLPQSNLSSQRATAAWGCAINAGKGAEYYQAVFAAQPAVEGDGYTDHQLLDLAPAVGIAGEELETFTKCVADNTYAGWSANSTQAFQEAGVSGTPTTILNGKEIEASKVADPAELEKALAEATKN